MTIQGWVRGIGMLVAVAAMSGTSSGRGGEEAVHLFILSGQSNMVGLNPDTSFTPAVTKALAPAKVLVVKDSVGGQPIRRWCKKPASGDGAQPARTGDLYDRLMKKVKATIEGKRPATVTFVWMQGERDAREKRGDTYAASLKRLVGQLDTDLGRKDINVVIGRLSDFDMANKRYPHWTRIREVQVAFAEEHPRGAWVDTDDLNGQGNALHYTREGYKELGARFAAKALALLKDAAESKE